MTQEKLFNDSVGMDKPALSHQNTYFNCLSPQTGQDSLSCILASPQLDQNLLGRERFWTEFFLQIWGSGFVEWERWSAKILLKTRSIGVRSWERKGFQRWWFQTQLALNSNQRGNSHYLRRTRGISPSFCLESSPILNQEVYVLNFLKNNFHIQCI